MLLGRRLAELLDIGARTAGRGLYANVGRGMGRPETDAASISLVENDMYSVVWHVRAMGTFRNVRQLFTITEAERKVG